MKCLPSCSSWPRLASSSEGLHPRRVCSFTVSRHQPGVRRPHPPPQTDLISKSHSRALPRRFNSRSPVQLTIILDSSDDGGKRVSQQVLEGFSGRAALWRDPACWLSLRRLFGFDGDVFGQVSVSQYAIGVVLVKNDKGSACLWRFQEPFGARDANQGAARCFKPKRAKRFGSKQVLYLRRVWIHGLGRAYDRGARKLRAKL